MLRRLVICLGFVICFLALPGSAVAQTFPSVVIRALLPQPSTGLPEWILLERTDGNTASFSATVRDTHGSTKAYTWIWQENQSWSQITASQSGIALNNDQDGVTVEVSGVQLDSSAFYSSSQRDMVWTKLSNAWEWLTLAEFEERWETGDWDLDPVATATPSPLPSPPASGTPAAVPSSFAATSQASRSIMPSQTERPPPTPYPGKAIRLEAVKRKEIASPAAHSQSLSFVEPDYAAEQARYQAWLQWWRRALGLFLGSWVCWMSVIAVPLFQRLKRRTTRRWGWSLLS